MSSISGPQLALVDARGERRVQQQRARGAAREHRVAVAVRAGHGEALLGEQVVEVVLAAARVDQVRRQLGVERGHDAGLAERAAELLEAVRDDRVSLRPTSAGVASLSSISSACSPRATPSSPAPSPARPIGPSAASSAASAPALPRCAPTRVLLALDDGAGNGRLELVDAAQQSAELEAAEELAHRRAVGRVGERLAEVDVEREVALDRRQQLRALRVLAVLDQRLAPLLARHGSPRSRRCPRASRSARAGRPRSCRRCPGTPAMSSEVSPLRPMKSGTSRGGMP